MVVNPGSPGVVQKCKGDTHVWVGRPIGVILKQGASRGSASASPGLDKHLRIFRNSDPKGNEFLNYLEVILLDKPWGVLEPI